MREEQIEPVEGLMRVSSALLSETEVGSVYAAIMSQCPAKHMGAHIEHIHNRIYVHKHVSAFFKQSGHMCEHPLNRPHTHTE